MKNKGISLILLVITIIIIIIIASAVILNLNNNNPVDKARLANVQSTRDSLKSGINLYIGKIMVDENGNHRAQTMILGKNEEVEKYKIITGDFREDYETIFTNKQIWQLDYNRVNSLVNVKLDIYDANSRWYIDEYGNPYLVYDKLSNVAPYLKTEDSSDILSSVKDFVVYLDKDIEFSENTQPEPKENITSSIVINKNSNSTATISGFSRNGIKSITYTGPRQGTITPTINGNNYTAVANVGNGDYTFTVTDNNDEILTKEETISGITSFTVGSVEDLCRFRDYVNMGDDFAGVTVTQTTDLDLNENKYTENQTTKEVTFTNDAIQWVPIGTEENKFSGTFDGNNHTINGIYINNNLNKQALFSSIENAIIKNLALGIGNITVLGESSGIVCNATNSYISNCINNCNVTARQYNVSGIVYQIVNSSQGKIENCINNGKITVENQFTASGVCAVLKNSSNIKIENSINNGKVNVKNDGGSGIVSYIDACSNCSIINCANNSEIEIGGYNAGGLVNYIMDTNSGIKLQKCYNKGKVSAKKDGVGGIVAMNASKDLLIQDCYNLGTISSDTYTVGGILGQLYKTNTINPYAIIENCYNIGTLSVGNNYCSAILGRVTMGSATVTNCYYLQGQSNSSNFGTAKTSSELKNLNSTLGASFKADTNNINNGYPILSWQQ